MFETPQFLACFLLPFSLVNIQCIFQAEHTYSPQPQAQYTSDPEHGLLCLASMDENRMILFISTKVFFEVNEATAITPIPWNHWGAAHVHIFEHEARNAFMVHVRGNRVLLASQIMSETHEYELRMISPLAVANRRGLGRVVKDRTTIVQSGEWHEKSGDRITQQCLTTETSLPYVSVVSDRKIGGGWLEDAWMDKDRIYLLLTWWDTEEELFRPSKLDVIDTKQY
jgi:hypothetical protein